MNLKKNMKKNNFNQEYLHYKVNIKEEVIPDKDEFYLPKEKEDFHKIINFLKFELKNTLQEYEFPKKKIILIEEFNY